MEKTYETLRRTVAFLRVNGVPDADTMPIGRMWNEALIVKTIVDSQTRTEALLLRAAAASIMTKEGGQMFDKLIEGLGNG